MHHHHRHHQSSSAVQHDFESFLHVSILVCPQAAEPEVTFFFSQTRPKTLALKTGVDRFSLLHNSSSLNNLNVLYRLVCVFVCRYF